MRIEQLAIPAIRAIVKRPRLADLLFSRAPGGNPLREERFRNPYPVLAALSDGEHVRYNAMYQQWFVSGFEEAREILSSDAMVVNPQIQLLLDVRPYSKMSDRSRAFFSEWLVVSDPPAHTRIRRLVSKAFTPRQVAQLEPQVVKIANQMLDAIEGQPCPDLAASFTRALPINVISSWLGLPEEQWEWAHHASDQVAKLLDPFAGFDAVAMDAVIDEVHDVFLALAAQRRLEPQDDFVTRLVELDDDGDKFSEQEFISLVGLLMFAGHETTAGMLSTSIIALAEFPERRAELRDNPDIWPAAIEEFLRYDTSVQADPRTAARDIDVGGKTIKAGQNVLLMLGAANRDPRTFDDPNILRFDRDNSRPISFGHGIHYCVGGALARMELRVGLQAFLERFGDYTVDLDGVRWKRSVTIRLAEELPVRR